MKKSIRNKINLLGCLSEFLLDCKTYMCFCYRQASALVSTSLFSVLVCQQLQHKYEGEKARYRISTIYYMTEAYFCLLISGFFQMKS